MAKALMSMLAMGHVLVWCGWAQPVAAQPASQAAFRAVLLKYDERANAEADVGRLRALEADRAAELTAVLGAGLKFDDWRLILSGSEMTPMGGIFLRLLDAELNSPKSMRATYWNSGPGAILRQAEISAKSPLHGEVALIKRGSMVIVSGHFFTDHNGGPFFESARISTQPVTIERAKFHTPYFSLRIIEIGAPFPERRFP